MTSAGGDYILRRLAIFYLRKIGKDHLNLVLLVCVVEDGVSVRPSISRIGSCIPTRTCACFCSLDSMTPSLQCTPSCVFLSLHLVFCYCCLTCFHAAMQQAHGTSGTYRVDLPPTIMIHGSLFDGSWTVGHGPLAQCMHINGWHYLSLAVLNALCINA